MKKNKLRKIFRKKLYAHKVYKKFSLGILDYIEQARLLYSFKKYFFKTDLSNKNIFSLYYPLDYEINCFSIIKWLKSLNCTILLPKVNKNSKQLVFHIFDNKSLLIKNHMGIQEISGNSSFIPEVVVTPLIAFDLFGNRLGQGGGYYDYTIKKLRSNSMVRVVGIGYSWQQAPKLYSDPWDIKLDGIVTEKYYKIFKQM